MLHNVQVNQRCTLSFWSRLFIHLLIIWCYTLCWVQCEAQLVHVIPYYRAVVLSCCEMNRQADLSVTLLLGADRALPGCVAKPLCRRQLNNSTIVVFCSPTTNRQKLEDFINQSHMKIILQHSSLRKKKA